MKHQWLLTPSTDPVRDTMYRWRCRLCGAYSMLVLHPLGTDPGTLISSSLSSIKGGLTCDQAQEIGPAWHVLES